MTGFVNAAVEALLCAGILHEADLGSYVDAEYHLKCTDSMLSMIDKNVELRTDLALFGFLLS